VEDEEVAGEGTVVGAYADYVAGVEIAEYVAADRLQGLRVDVDV